MEQTPCPKHFILNFHVNSSNFYSFAYVPSTVHVGTKVSCVGEFERTSASEPERRIVDMTSTAH